ncbi:hypothetical protein EHQ05_15385 [Leptospira yasudae]|nr:hypothetical protein EHQ05_15385 [Leptospira yasudae]TGM05901.1 hypothetical protein EHQ86_10840 [Leptospira yasudae]
MGLKGFFRNTLFQDLENPIDSVLQGFVEMKLFDHFLEMSRQGPFFFLVVIVKKIRRFSFSALVRLILEDRFEQLHRPVEIESMKSSVEFGVIFAARFFLKVFRLEDHELPCRENMLNTITVILPSFAALFDCVVYEIKNREERFDIKMRIDLSVYNSASFDAETDQGMMTFLNK